MKQILYGLIVASAVISTGIEAAKVQFMNETGIDDGCLWLRFHAESTKTWANFRTMPTDVIDTTKILKGADIADFDIILSEYSANHSGACPKCVCGNSCGSFQPHCGIGWTTIHDRSQYKVMRAPRMAYMHNDRRNKESGVFEYELQVAEIPNALPAK